MNARNITIAGDLDAAGKNGGAGGILRVGFQRLNGQRHISTNAGIGGTAMAVCSRSARQPCQLPAMSPPMVLVAARVVS